MRAAQVRGAVGRPRAPPHIHRTLQTHLDGVDQVLDQEHASQITQGLVELGQNQVAVLVHHVFGQRHLLVQVLPVGDGKASASRSRSSSAAQQRRHTLSPMLNDEMLISSFSCVHF